MARGGATARRGFLVGAELLRKMGWHAEAQRRGGGFLDGAELMRKMGWHAEAQWRGGGFWMELN